MVAFPTDWSDELISAVVAVRLEKIKESSSYSIVIFCIALVKLLCSLISVVEVLFLTSILKLSSTEWSKLLDQTGSKQQDSSSESAPMLQSLGKQIKSGTLPVSSCNESTQQSAGATFHLRGSDAEEDFFFPPPPLLRNEVQRLPRELKSRS